MAGDADAEVIDLRDEVHTPEWMRAALHRAVLEPPREPVVAAHLAHMVDAVRSHAQV